MSKYINQFKTIVNNAFEKLKEKKKVIAISKLEKILNIYIPGDMFEEIYATCLSLTQSYRANTGKIWENAVKVIFDENNIPYSYQSSGVDGIPDFIIPSKNSYLNKETGTIVVSIKRTLRERWSQSYSEGRHKGCIICLNL